MTLVADSGSTKTIWAQVGKRRKLVTEGLNPHFTGEDRMRQVATEVRDYFGLAQEGGTVHFYGAGCGTEGQRERVRAILAEGLGTGTVEVETDMLGACRAVCGHEAGVVGILGTGSNCCCYDGERIVYQPVSTGWILGDHGSASHVGRKLLHGYLTGLMPYNIAPLFREAFPLTTEQWLDAVYHQPNANRFLASLAPFALRNGRFAYCFFAVLDSLKDWYRYQLGECLLRAGSREVSVVGGFGAAIGSPMQRFQEDEELVVRQAVADPIKGLLAYHGQNI